MHLGHIFRFFFGLPLFLSTEFCLFQLYFIHWIGSLITTVCRMHPLNLPSSYFTVFTWFLACFSFNVIFEFSTGSWHAVAAHG